MFSISSTLHAKLTHTTTTTILLPFYKSTCVSQHQKMDDFVAAKFYCPQSLANVIRTFGLG